MIGTFAYHEDTASEICPCCMDVFWAELGYWSFHEMLLWEGFYYAIEIHWTMGIRHYRTIDPTPQEKDEAHRRTLFVHQWAYMYPWTQYKGYFARLEGYEETEEDQ